MASKIEISGLDTTEEKKLSNIADHTFFVSGGALYYKSIYSLIKFPSQRDKGQSWSWRDTGTAPCNMFFTDYREVDVDIAIKHRV